MARAAVDRGSTTLHVARAVPSLPAGQSDRVIDREAPYLDRHGVGAADPSSSCPSARWYAKRTRADVLGRAGDKTGYVQPRPGRLRACSSRQQQRLQVADPVIVQCLDQPLDPAAPLAWPCCATEAPRPVTQGSPHRDRARHRSQGYHEHDPNTVGPSAWETAPVGVVSSTVTVMMKANQIIRSPSGARCRISVPRGSGPARPIRCPLDTSYGIPGTAGELP